MRAYIQLFDDKMTKKYSSRIELKSLAIRFAEGNNLNHEAIERLMIEVDRLKSIGTLSDSNILITAFQKVHSLKDL